MPGRRNMEFKKREIQYGNYPEAETEMDLDDSVCSQIG
jgi:hypothetical protein